MLGLISSRVVKMLAMICFNNSKAIVACTYKNRLVLKNEMVMLQL